MRIDASSGSDKLGIGEHVAKLTLKADGKADVELLTALHEYFFGGGAIQVWRRESIVGKKIRSLLRNHPKPDLLEVNRTRLLRHEANGAKKIKKLGQKADEG